MKFKNIINDLKKYFLIEIFKGLFLTFKYLFKKKVTINYPSFPKDVKRGETVLVDDGKIILQVEIALTLVQSMHNVKILKFTE